MSTGRKDEMARLISGTARIRHVRALLAFAHPRNAPAEIRCVECRCTYRRADRAVWHLLFVDTGEVAAYCGFCRARELDG